MGETFKNIKVSIIMTVLDSCAVVERQIKYFRKLNLPDDVEIIFMDDGSDPPLKEKFAAHRTKNFNIYPTGDNRYWTQACARNLGALIAQGEYLFMTDIDQIIPIESINAVREFAGDNMKFRRRFGVLTYRGDIDTRLKTLFRYGLDKEYYEKKGTHFRTHMDTFAIKRSIFVALDGYHPAYCERPKGGHKGEPHFNNKYKRHGRRGYCKAKEYPEDPNAIMYAYPGLPEDRYNLFHSLKRYSNSDPFK